MIKSVVVKILFVSSLSFLMMLSSCYYLIDDIDSIDDSYVYYKPIYADPEVAHNIYVANSKVIEKPDKIFTYLNYLIVNIKGEGFHVIDNTSPSVPINKYFINIPGSNDVAIKDGTIFVDNYDDIVAFVIDENQEVVIKQRLEAAIASIPPYGNALFECVDSSKGVVINWEETYSDSGAELPECYTE